MSPVNAYCPAIPSNATPKGCNGILSILFPNGLMPPSPQEYWGRRAIIRRKSNESGKCVAGIAAHASHAGRLRAKCARVVAADSPAAFGGIGVCAHWESREASHDIL